MYNPKFVEVDPVDLKARVDYYEFERVCSREAEKRKRVRMSTVQEVDAEQILKDLREIENLNRVAEEFIHGSIDRYLDKHFGKRMRPTGPASSKDAQYAEPTRDTRRFKRTVIEDDFLWSKFIEALVEASDMQQAR